MEDMRAQLQKLRSEAAECAVIAAKATTWGKRDLFTRLAQHYRILAAEVERAIKEDEARWQTVSTTKRK
jgi:hypothetical protein